MGEIKRFKNKKKLIFELFFPGRAAKITLFFLKKRKVHAEKSFLNIYKRNQNIKINYLNINSTFFNSFFSKSKKY
jgi:hypothetical protein